MIRTVVMAAAVLVLVLLAFCEIGLAWPVPWWLYLCLAGAFAGGLLRPVPVRRQLPGVSVLAAVLAGIAALYWVDWSTRKPFLRDLGRVRTGMTEAEVRRIMSRHLEGTGWLAAPVDHASGGTLSIAGSSSRYSTIASASDEMVIRGALVFRHSTNAAFNSDWGIVSFSGGRVVRVEFSPD